MTLSVGDTFPQVTLKYIPFDAENPDACAAPRVIDTAANFAGKKVVVIGVPGAFTPTCSAQHIPGYNAKIAELKAKGVDLIVCVSGNDFFVMSAWGRALHVKDNIIMAGDGNGELGRATGLGLDLTAAGMGPARLTRFAAIVDNGKVVHIGTEPDPTQVTVSGADSILAAL
ncbi:peroxiredoxin type-2 [Coemansia javaensis]|uniref:Thioredoxin-dependent peroxiredoxin n=1 Tax=Coemansia javaensis TaxID=2761396 RepID=A0A9W8HLS6_9FUNG|nr:peroxiredoxin type-2 [Coemansia javaensis]